MKAVVATAFGGPEVLALQDLPDPEPTPHQLLIDVEFCDVGTLDRLVRSGWGREYFDVEPPYTPGDGVGGVVRAVGADTDDSWIGRRVVAGTGPRNASGLSAAPIGGYADTAIADERAVVAVPDDVPLDLATALLNDGPTSQLLTDVADPGPGDVVLVLAAAGAAGVLLVQLASARGADVIAAARGPHKTAALRKLGLRHVVDYGEADWTDRVRAVAPDGPSVVFDGAGSDLGRAGCALAADGARIVAYGSSAGEFADIDTDEAKARGITVTGLFDLPSLTPADRNRLVERAFGAARSGAARPLIGRVPFADAAQAHTALENRTALGKTVLVV